MSNSGSSLINKTNKCSCKGYNLDKLLQPQILTLLVAKPLHGYIIIQELENKMLNDCGKLDPTGIYRTLKTLEEKELITSQWDIQGAGAAKRIYQATPAGNDCLKTWIKTLEDYQKTIALIIDDAKNILDTTH
jgi:poly-beta-hydroxybutyrate-responsive repressor